MKLARLLLKLKFVEVSSYPKKSTNTVAIKTPLYFLDLYDCCSETAAAMHALPQTHNTESTILQGAWQLANFTYACYRIHPVQLVTWTCNAIRRKVNSQIPA